MNKDKTKKLTDQQLTTPLTGRPSLAATATAEQWSKLFEYLCDHHSTAFEEWGRVMGDHSAHIVRFYDLLMEHLLADSHLRGVHIEDREVSLLNAFNEADFERLSKKAASQ
jgi:hypothetical protein